MHTDALTRVFKVKLESCKLPQGERRDEVHFGSFSEEFVVLILISTDKYVGICTISCPAVQCIKNSLLAPKCGIKLDYRVLNLDRNTSKDLQWHDSSIYFNEFKKY